MDDPAQYTLGTLPSTDDQLHHHVALTMLGDTATNAASNGCANMVRSFPSINVVVMVGIAAGVPAVNRPERHVRLGDIVVATEGVVDYDHVHALPGGTELRRGFPMPSARLTRCATILKTEELSGAHPWEQWLDVTATRTELTGYARPPDSTDVVHDSSGYRLDHPRRSRSGHRKGWPKVHLGLIGSADRSLRDVLVRDRLASEHRVLAIEMEGAGIGSSGFLNEVQWFMVRGISDYGDAHRNDTWRRYASLAAAAYVRSLLAVLTPMGQGDVVETKSR
ncbi:nucleoside phosphorylase [Kibdelosporangium banguiense]|uniref:Nucleoside phosphorylase n=1 Tax=Kibdelosporangium banguiense TaxID=1365924 RepID=A0ABS4TBY2_9PSEU|nr:hypothetical protein [Kibdelosporangium banguiense]MBP2321925.1 nucleoside phosphorylase [Kibdelosporangium banguiense]